MIYDYHESFSHKLAKELLYQWLLNHQQEKGYRPFLPFGFRTDNSDILLEPKDELFDTSHVMFVPDIAIIHKGCPKIFIEVVHKHSTPQYKIDRIRDFCKGYHWQLFEIDANNILSQTNKYCNLKFKLIAGEESKGAYCRMEENLLNDNMPTTENYMYEGCGVNEEGKLTSLESIRRKINESSHSNSL